MIPLGRSSRASSRPCPRRHARRRCRSRPRRRRATGGRSSARRPRRATGSRRRHSARLVRCPLRPRLSAGRAVGSENVKLLPSPSFALHPYSAAVQARRSVATGLGPTPSPPASAPARGRPAGTRRRSRPDRRRRCRCRCRRRRPAPRCRRACALRCRPPGGVNFTAFVTRFMTTCLIRRSSADTSGRSRSTSSVSVWLACPPALGRASALPPGHPSSRTGSVSSSIRPASTFETSSTSLMRLKRCWPERRMFCRYCSCFGFTSPNKPVEQDLRRSR